MSNDAFIALCKGEPTTDDDLRELPLKPRAVATLCSLRISARTIIAVRSAIGDQSTSATRDLLGDLRDMRLVGMIAGGSWRLTATGCRWCKAHGLRVASEILESTRTVA